MRNAVMVDPQTVITIDNSGCIGEKPDDAVQVPNKMAAYFTVRVALFEQWCAGAMPVHIAFANFTGDAAWQDYVEGMKLAFDEIGIDMPSHTSSTETNFQSMQSALSITLIGKKRWEVSHKDIQYFAVGKPLVGQQVLENPKQVASLKEIYECLSTGIIKALWPTGSKGVGHEIKRFIGPKTANLDLQCTAGPSTVVLVAVDRSRVEEFYQRISAPITSIL